MMAAIRSSHATVYHGGGRRYLTIKAAARSEARSALRKAENATGEKYHDDDYHKRLARLTRFYLQIWKMDRAKASRTDETKG